MVAMKVDQMDLEMAAWMADKMGQM